MAAPVQNGNFKMLVALFALKDLKKTCIIPSVSQGNYRDIGENLKLGDPLAQAFYPLSYAIIPVLGQIHKVLVQMVEAL